MMIKCGVLIGPPRNLISKIRMKILCSVVKVNIELVHLKSIIEIQN